MKQKESSGTVTVPGRTHDNGELNGVLNGKSSVFSHRFNVIAALTLLRSAISFAAVSPSCVSLLLCFVFLPNSPLTLHAQISHSPLFAVFSRLSTLDFFPFHSLSHPLLSASSWPLQDPHVILYTMGSFLPHVHNGPFGFAMSVRPHIVSFCETLEAPLIRMSPLAI